MDSPHRSRRRHALVATVVTGLIAGPCIAADIVLVLRPASPEGDDSQRFSRCVSGSRIVRLDTTGGVRSLTPGFDGACDPAVSFDGSRILFSARRTPDEGWQIWLMDSDGTGAAQLTTHDGDATAPLWVGSIFHLDDEAPTPRIAYLATASSNRATTWLHTADLDGSHPVRISFPMTSDLDADVLPNGRLVYPSWRPDARTGDRPGLSLMGLNIDGTDLMAFADPHSGPTYPHAIRISNDGRAYFIDSSTGELTGGDISFVTLRRPLHSYSVLAGAAGGAFLDPLPLTDGGLVASYRRPGSSSFELVRVDPDDGTIGPTLFGAEGESCLDANELIARPQVKGRSTVVDLDRETGVFFCISSHITDRTGPEYPAHRPADRLRVIAGSLAEAGDPEPEEAALGEALLAADGSFHIEVPARTPLRFQLLDDAGSIVGEQESWTWVMPREWRGCIGCHEDREMVAPNVLAEAIVKPAIRLVGPETTAEEGE